MVLSCPTDVGLCSQIKAVYAPKGFILHAASLRQGFPHCEIFSTAATRRCRGRVSVPSVEVRLSPLLAVIALVGRYPTNKLIARRPFPKRFLAVPFLPRLLSGEYRGLVRLSADYTRLRGKYLRVTTSFATLPLRSCELRGIVRLACLIHAASVRPEPGSNSL